MYSQQDIFRKHLANQYAKLDNNTRMVLFPVRLETKIINKRYNKTDATATVLYLFKALWQLLCSLDKNRVNQQKVENNLKNALFQASMVQAMYPHDKRLIDSILDKIEKLMTPYTTQLAEIKAEVARIPVIRASKQNRAECLFKEAKVIHSHIYNSSYNGQLRCLNGNFSVVAYYRRWAKILRKAISFMEKLPNELKDISSISSDSELYDIILSISDIEAITQNFNQYIPKSLPRALDSIKDLSSIESRIDANIFEKQKLNGHEKSLVDIYNSICPKLFKKLGDLGENFRERNNNIVDRSKKQVSFEAHLIHNVVVNNKEVHMCRYTLLAFYLLDWKINKIGDKSYKLRDKDLQRVQSLASRCMFDYSEELQWMHSIVRAYNRDNADDKEVLISNSALNKTSGLIRLQKGITTISKKEHPCLCIRIYPDDLVLTQLDKSITPQEKTDARYFLEEYFYKEIGEQQKSTNPNLYKMRGVSDCRRTAWDNLCQKYSPSRAAWIVQCVVKGGKNLEVRENKDIFTVPVTNLMPSRFSAQATMRLGEHKELKLTGYGNRLPNVLHVGLNLNDKNASDDMLDSNRDTGLKFTSPELKWMTDYDEAEKIGMAITIPLRGFRFNKKQGNKRPKDFEFDTVYVSGIKENLNNDINEGIKLINDLFEARLYSDEGMDLIKIGTPTNITDNDSEPIYNSSEENSKEIFFALLSKRLNVIHLNKPVKISGSGKTIFADQYIYSWDVNSTDKQSDADNLSKLFYLNRIGSSVLQETPLADKNDFEKSRLANEAILEYFAEQQENDNIKFPLFALLNTDPYKSFFLNYVSARGSYSSIRIGAQPYGITTVGDFRNIPIIDSKIKTLHFLISFLTNKWNTVADTNHAVEKKDNGSEFLELMGKTPISCNFEKQESVRIDNFLDADYFKGTSKNSIFSNIEQWLFINMFKDFTKYIVNYKYIPLLEKKFTVKMSNDEVDATIAPLLNAVKSKLSSKSKETTDEEAKNLICEFFDLFTHRLDAWVSGFLNYQQNTSNNNRSSIVIGCYGWVFNLKNQNEKDITKELQEHVLAPSVNQAITAGVLRGSYLNRDAANNDSEVVNINMSSARIRKAIRIIEGVRNGLNVGAILGADLEHLLHEEHKHSGLELDEYIWPLRQAFPQTESDVHGKDSQKTTNVLNGALLIQNLRSIVDDLNNVMNISEFFTQNNSKFKTWCANMGLPSNSKKEARLLADIQEIYDSYDALMDVVLSDGIYQLCRGNVDAATAIMNALQEEKMIPMPSVTEIQLNHARIENKVITMFDPTETFGNGLNPLDTTDLRIGEWAKSVMPDFKLADYISPLEMIYLSADIDSLKAFIKYIASEQEDLSSIVEEYEFIANSARDMLGQSHPVCFEDFMNESPAVEVKEWYDYSDLRSRYDAIYKTVDNIAAKCQTLVSNAEDMKSAYSEIFGQSQEGNINKSNLGGLANKRDVLADKYLNFRKNAIPVLLQCFRLGYTSVIANMIRLNLLDKTIELTPTDYIDLNSTVTGPKPKKRAELVRDMLPNIDFIGIATFMKEVQAEIKKRMTTASITGCTNNSKATDKIDREGYECIVNAIRALTMSNVTVLPVAIIDNISIENEEGVKQNILPVDTFNDQLNHQVMPNASVIDDYLSQMANLRPNMQSLYMQLIFSTMAASADSAAPQFVPLQLPSHIQEVDGKKVMKWLGSDDNITEDLISDTNVYAVCNPQFVPQKEEPTYRICGLVIDYWVEKIPLKNQVAGLTFKFDQPDAEPPQAILMVMPRPHMFPSGWSERYLFSSLKSVIHMVKCRAVEPDHLILDRWIGGLLPLFDFDLKGLE